jgi:RNA polymerase sigma-70 factor (ECF subfamily)
MSLRFFARPSKPGARAPPSLRDGGGGSVYFTREPYLGFGVTEPDETTEQRFIERLVARDERAFNELVKMYERRIFGLLLRMIGRRDEAEDLAQEVFVQVFKAIGTFRGEAKLSTWIFRIAMNLSKNRSKYLARRRTDSQDHFSGAGEEVPIHRARNSNMGVIDRPDDLLSGVELEAIVERSISELEPEFREVLILRDVEDMSYEEIAEITGLADGTVKSRIHRARLQLKQAVELALGEKIG